MVKSRAGKFIVIEGIDGAGSTTQAQRLTDRLNASMRQAVQTAEPTRGPVGVLLRQILSGRVVATTPDGGHAEVHNDVIALLFAADRLDHLQCEVLPHLAAGTDVVSDRYYHSSFLYQSLAGDLDWIRTLNAHARPPDVTYVLNIGAAEAAQRRRVRGSQEIYETDAIQSRLVQGYRDLPQLLPDETIVGLDGSLDPDAVELLIAKDLRQRFQIG